MPRIAPSGLLLTTSLIASLSLLGCSSSDDSSSGETAPRAGSDASKGGTGGAGGQTNKTGSSSAGQPSSNTSSGSATEAPTDESAGARFSGTFSECVAALKPSCTYEEKGTACASLRTPKVPLSNGESWGDVELKAGPYGGFVAWNQGKDFANPIAAGESTCNLLAGAFGEPNSVTQDILNLRGQDLSLYTIFRPACMKDGEKYPVITWGNGTCGQSGGYATLLATVASHGFVVIASNSRFTDGGNKEMLKALDLAKALNDDENSLYHNKLDLDKIGAMGHSQGSSATAHAASDPRIKAVILFNAGLSSMDKPFLAVSGERDITSYTPDMMAKGLESATQPGAWLFYHQVLQTGGNVTGHLTLMEQPERVVPPTVAWWNYMLKGDAEAGKMFTGADCELCKSKDQYEYGQRSLK
jgi:pimeloyl-ACP methyl ester carboxylesterase